MSEESNGTVKLVKRIKIKRGIAYYLNGSDNCPELYSLSLDDFDSDGPGDACDPDHDNDGILMPGTQTMG